MVTKKKSTSSKAPDASIEQQTPASQTVELAPISRRKSPVHEDTTASKPQSKQDVVLGLLRQPSGSSLDALMQATGWQAHSMRGFLSGTVKKRMGLGLTSEPSEHGRIYRLSAPAVEGAADACS